jgi:glycosyltransferase involved in cell wall biosynthesis
MSFESNSDQIPLNVLHIAFHSSIGGATRSMLRLHRGLRAIGAESRLLVREGKTGPDCDQFDPVIPESARLHEQLFGYFVQHKGIETNRSAMSNTVFTLPYPGFDLSGHPAVGPADILNLHWPSYVISPVTLKMLLELGKPVFWTIHDQWAYTGGCHYTAGCVNYEKSCSSCPQLEGDFSRLPAVVLRERKLQLAGHTLHIVGPSKWIVDRARRSSLLRGQPIHQIPYGIETDLFYPVDTTQARASLDLPADAFILLFGADHLKEKRKGWHHLQAALELVVEKLQGRVPIHLAFFGNPPDVLTELPIPTHELGYISDDQKLREAYSAADLFLLPSLEDNQPNTVMEAMACGTPTAGFEVGALPEMIVDSQNGYLAATGDSSALGEAIIRCATNQSAQPAVRSAARQTIESRYPLRLQAERYVELYRNALASTKAPKRNATHPDRRCPLSGDAGRMLKDRDFLRPLGQLLKLESGRDAPFDPGSSFGTRKESRRFRHYLKTWISSLPIDRRYYLTDDHAIYSHNTVSLRAGFRNPEGPYPEINLPWPLVWSELPEAEFEIKAAVNEGTRLRFALQSPIPELQIELYGSGGRLWQTSLPGNLCNPEESQLDFTIRLPQMERAARLQWRFQLPAGLVNHDNLAVAFFRLEVNFGRSVKSNDKK